MNQYIRAIFVALIVTMDYSGQAISAEKKAGASVSISRHVDSWTPSKTKKGVGVNVQPDGRSAIGISVKDVEFAPSTYITIGKYEVREISILPDRVSFAIPKQVIENTGKYEIIIHEPKVVTRVGAFVVN